ncbi:MAG TPA: amidohydrolase family protein [Candidatus Acidoferrum sp.]|nr:amidohydrolase family protein [Candidatus Acidoferrum sp.]
MSAPLARQTLLRARLVLPVSQPLISDGAVLIHRNRIRAVGRWRDLAPKAGTAASRDLGEVILMPGLVNAHCHLDYTDMAGQLLPPSVFSDWLKLITYTKSGWSYSDYAKSWLRGAQMLVRTGTTTVADIEAVPQLLPEVWGASPLRVLSFLEMIAFRPDRQPSRILQETLDRIAALGFRRCRAVLSPHAPYTAVPELLRLSARAARRRRWPLTTHVAESAPEYEMFARARGDMFDWLKRSGRDMSDCGLGSPVEHLERCGVLGRNLLVAHANYLGRSDPALLARRGVSVVHCPRSHSYFRHGPFPLRRLARAGVNLCLGTDSLASVYRARRQTVELNLFDEMRALAQAQPWLSARKILDMATVNGARALGMQGQIGELRAGAYADLVALPFAGKRSDAHEAILHHAGDVSASLIDGRWAVEPATSDEPRPGP